MRKTQEPEAEVLNTHVFFSQAAERLQPHRWRQGEHISVHDSLPQIPLKCQFTK